MNLSERSRFAAHHYGVHILVLHALVVFTTDTPTHQSDNGTSVLYLLDRNAELLL